MGNAVGGYPKRPRWPWLQHSTIFSFSTLPNNDSRAIHKILIANRGEIACRIIRTARSLGIRTVAVYSEADRNSLHVRSADEAVCIGPASAQLSYLSTSAVLDAARRTGADAIHPGYGFLSENAKFAQSCNDSGITFIGPSAAAISLMGDKSASKKVMSAANVPVVPGYHGDDQNHQLLYSEANNIGYPVLIKPVLGGGGKGMRIVNSKDEFVESLMSAIRESRAAFGDTRMLIEKYIGRPRHIEVQIFGDKLGNVVHLFERDCSVQRRHQKIIEEAPAPLMSEEFRHSIGMAAVNAAKAVNYENAGTVEFIVDTSTGEFFFMEMNTRLQVEHPVTEMITCQDLVEWQIRVANGERLPLQQNELTLSGHAFEARIYAENVPRGFLPAAGQLHHYVPPIASSTVRIETGVEQNDAVSVHYDPMIAKLVVWSSDRNLALTKLHNCLSNFQVAGLPTNIGFLQNLVKHPAFRRGEVETHFIEHFKEDLFQESVTDVSRFAALAAVGICIYAPHSAGKLWNSPSGFRVNHEYTRNFSLVWNTETEREIVSLHITYFKANEFLVKFPSKPTPDIHIRTKQISNEGCSTMIEMDGVSSTVHYALYLQKSAYHIHVWKEDTHQYFTIPLRNTWQVATNQSTQRHESTTSQLVKPGSVVAPMAGLVVKTLAEMHQTVKAGDPLLVMEAMKMEHTVRAPISGVVTAINVVAGKQVTDGAVLYCITAT